MIKDRVQDAINVFSLSWKFDIRMAFFDRHFCPFMHFIALYGLGLLLPQFEIDLNVKLFEKKNHVISD